MASGSVCITRVRKLSASMDVKTAFRRIKLALRFIAPLTIALALLAFALVPLAEELTLRWWVNDLEIRSRLVANTM